MHHYRTKRALLRHWNTPSQNPIRPCPKLYTPSIRVHTLICTQQLQSRSGWSEPLTIWEGSLVVRSLVCGGCALTASPSRRWRRGRARGGRGVGRGSGVRRAEERRATQLAAALKNV
eukprot:6204036-Pleurochrysis_carterae.AAC.8